MRTYEGEIVETDGQVAVKIPKELLEKLGWEVGDEIEIEMDEEKNEIKMKLVDKGLMDWIDKFIKRYQSALKELSQE
ncbi:hypothetical protein AKJ56_02335 [candidate division MSBL1 archaeon SCGC-AAA382N08]|uniref:SpoVT-AbrB domain-containing protein n=1 Tax=candidate division MSBL1 archaeon SCGC-AAA382N08 TaxID=1698285 RepID=A0A133VN05_9EURY|nr:hypothetical protein AKJ56_02335 [candidate division MSBL1 archaeon SCGC-AAA382N08]